MGISPRSYYQVKNIIENAPEELKDKVRSGQTSISYADKMVRRTDEHKPENIPKLPESLIHSYMIRITMMFWSEECQRTNKYTRSKCNF